MKYFKLEKNAEPKAIGVRNGVYQGEVKWKSFKNKKTVAEIQEYFSINRYRTNYFEIKPFNFYFEYVEACKGAKMTDFFCFSPALWGVAFFITNTAKVLFCKFNLPVHTYIPVKIYHKEIEYHYWALYIPYSYRFDSIDFNKTIFFSGTLLQGKQFLQFKDEGDWNKNRVFGIEKLFFNDSFDTSLDLFSSSFSGGGYYISERLKIAIEEAGLTGIVIKEPKEPELIFE